MALLEIIEFPDERLRTVAKPVTVFDAALQQLVDDMFETMYAAPGIGLAATQVNVHRQLIVMDLSEEKNERRVFINPRILDSEGEQVYQEGCLSVPGIFADVKRAERLTVHARDASGHEFTLQADGLLAVCIQHEMDHLAGKVFVDYLSPLKRQLVKRKMDKRHKEQAAERKADAASNAQKRQA